MALCFNALLASTCILISTLLCCRMFPKVTLVCVQTVGGRTQNLKPLVFPEKQEANSKALPLLKHDRPVRHVDLKGWNHRKHMMVHQWFGSLLFLLSTDSSLVYFYIQAKAVCSEA